MYLRKNNEEIILFSTFAVRIALQHLPYFKRRISNEQYLNLISEKRKKINTTTYFFNVKKNNEEISLFQSSRRTFTILSLKDSNKPYLNFISQKKNLIQNVQHTFLMLKLGSWLVFYILQNSESRGRSYFIYICFY